MDGLVVNEIHLLVRRLKLQGFINNISLRRLAPRSLINKRSFLVSSPWLLVFRAWRLTYPATLALCGCWWSNTFHFVGNLTCSNVSFVPLEWVLPKAQGLHPCCTGYVISSSLRQTVEVHLLIDEEWTFTFDPSFCSASWCFLRCRNPSFGF